MLRGGISDPGNRSIMKMFNLISIGERAGSGVPDILAVWKGNGWNVPQIEESFHPDRTVLTLEFEENVPKNMDGKEDSTDGGEKKNTAKTRNYRNAILNFMQSGVWYRASELTGVAPVGERRIRYLLSEMTERKLLEESGTAEGGKTQKITPEFIQKAGPEVKPRQHDHRQPPGCRESSVKKVPEKAAEGKQWKGNFWRNQAGQTEKSTGKRLKSIRNQSRSGGVRSPVPSRFRHT